MKTEEKVEAKATVISESTETEAKEAAEATEDSSEVKETEKTPTKTPTKTPSKKKAPNTPKSPKSVGYMELVQDAIVSLKDRTGSSQPAIQKYILQKHPEMDPEKVKRQLLKTLKVGVKSNRFQKVKASYKIHPEYKKKMKSKKKQAKAAEAKKKNKPSAAELAAQKEKEKQKAKEKARLERIRKRKFPMEDLKLIAEDKELKVSNKLPSRPSLKAVFPNAPSACKSDSMRTGILDDAFAIYHFFRGDVGWGLDEKNGVAPFTLEQWLECIKQVLSGVSKRTKLLPPLMTHLFVVALQNLVPIELQAALTPASWSEILMLYMDAMDRHELDMMENSNALSGLAIDTEYLFQITDEPKIEAEMKDDQIPSYLKSLGKTHSRLLTHDPWMLNADELLTLLRTLVDDLLAQSPESAFAMDERLDEAYERLKVKRTADSNFRKLQTTRNKEQAEIKADLKENAENGAKSTRSNTKTTTVSEAMLDSALRTKEKANNAYEKYCRSKPVRTERIGLDRNFHEVYHFWNDPERVYILNRGKTMPSVPYKLPGLETYKTSWQSIDKRSVLETYLESLDVRGERESVLYEALYSATRYVHDDIKIANEKKAVLKEKKDIQRKLENAKLKCEFGRKSGRLAAQSEEEFAALQAEIDLLEETIAKGKEIVKPDLEEMTGLNMLRSFDGYENNPGRRVTRRDTQQEDEEDNRLPRFQCSQLWSTGNIDGTGVIGAIVWDLLQLEKRLDTLIRSDKDTRKKWTTSLETAAYSWHTANPPFVEEVDAASTPLSSPMDEATKAKRQKLVGTPTSPAGSNKVSSSTIIAMLRVSFYERDLG